MDQFFSNSASIKTIAEFWLLTAATMIPYALCCAIAVATFLAFRRLPPHTTAGKFFKMYSIGLLLCIPVAAAIYIYDLNVCPKLKARSTEIIYKMRMGSFPNEIGAEEYKPIFENFTAAMTSRTLLHFRIDSLKTEYKALKSECEDLLSQLPDSIATKAYDAYKFDKVGVDYRSADIASTFTSDSLNAERVTDLYQLSWRVHENWREVIAYRAESTARTVNALAFLLAFLIFAPVGYALRNKTLRLILGIIAVIILTGSILQLLSNQTKQYAEESFNTAREYKRR